MNEHSNSLLSQILAEQMKQTELLTQIAQSKRETNQLLTADGLQPGEEVVERERDVPTYLDGSPCL